MKKQGGFLRSFGYAFSGIVNAIKNERNFRIHMCMAAYVLIFAFIGTPPRDDMARLVLCFGLVMGLELVNTSIEKLCDTVTEEENEKIKVAKDTAAGAVLVVAIISAVVGLITFLEPHVFRRIMSRLCTMPIVAVLIALSIPFAVWFIIGWKKK